MPSAWYYGLDCGQLVQSRGYILRPLEPTLCRSGQSCVLAVHPKVSATLCAAGMANEADYCVATLDYENIGEMNLDTSLRRLTPTECERLQGYPDGWTAYGADSKPVSDTQRYQMLGNSVAVPCVAYIMQGIVDAYEKGGANV